MTLGEKIRKERQKRGWSLKKLSSLINVSIMTLQRIETGKVSPSVELLTEIAYQLDLPVTEFVSDKERTLVHIKPADLPTEDLGAIKRRCLFPKSLVTEGLSIWLGEFEPGGVVDVQTEERLFEGAHQLEGQVEIELDDRKVRLQAGETVYYDARFRQKLKSNNGGKAIVVIKDA